MPHNRVFDRFTSLPLAASFENSQHIPCFVLVNSGTVCLPSHSELIVNTHTLLHPLALCKQHLHKATVPLTHTHIYTHFLAFQDAELLKKPFISEKTTTVSLLHGLNTNLADLQTSRVGQFQVYQVFPFNANIYQRSSLSPSDQKKQIRAMLGIAFYS